MQFFNLPKTCFHMSVSPTTDQWPKHCTMGPWWRFFFHGEDGAHEQETLKSRGGSMMNFPNSDWLLIVDNWHSLVVGFMTWEDEHKHSTHPYPRLATYRCVLWFLTRFCIQIHRFRSGCSGLFNPIFFAFQIGHNIEIRKVTKFGVIWRPFWGS